MRLKTLRGDGHIRAIFQTIQLELHIFHSMEPLHMLKHNNQEVDQQENLAVKEKCGMIHINKGLSIKHIR
jgi:hypothetical protein